MHGGLRIGYDPMRGFYIRRRRPHYDVYSIVFIASLLAIYLSKFFLGTPFVGLGIALLIALAGASMKDDLTVLLFGLSIVTLWLSIEYTQNAWPFGIFWALALAFIYSKATAPSVGKTVLYRPPREVRPAEMAYMVEDREANEREFLVAIMDLANRNYIELIPSKRDFYIRKIRDFEDDKSLNAIDRFILDRLFVMTGVRIVAETGIRLRKDEFPNEVSLSYVLDNLHNWAKAFDLQFRTHLSENKPIYKRLFVVTKQQWQSFALAFLISGIVFLFIRRTFIQMTTSTTSSRRILWNIVTGEGLPIVLLSAGFFWLSYHYIGVLTDFGRKVVLKVLGFREFLKRVELPRIKRFLREKRFTLTELFTYAIALKLLDLIDLWISGLKTEEEMAEEVKNIEKLWTFLKFRWKLEKIRKELEAEATGAYL